MTVMKKTISLITALAIMLSIASMLCACGDSSTKDILKVQNNDDKKSFTMAELLSLDTEKVRISWLNKKGETGSEEFTGIYFDDLFAADENIGKQKVTYTVTDKKGKEHTNEFIVNYASGRPSTFVAINSDNTLSLIYPQITIDHVNKELWLDGIKKIERKSESILLTLSVDDEIKYLTENDLDGIDETTQTFAWTDVDGSSGEDKFTGYTLRDLDLDIPNKDFMIIGEDARGVEYNLDIDYNFQVQRIENYCNINFDEKPKYDTLVKKMLKANPSVPEPMIAKLKNDSYLFVLPQISGDCNKDYWIYNLESIAIETQ